ncbi:hypothetical protein D9E63_14200 [Escherichia coli]|nr:hypothetical protein [Escherichia coli]EEW1616133.1 hypothetical protein [Escherichia coli]EEW1845693.1 hypothetical protein [Escherichia coli]EEW1981612.1 hypothetical protein [Escherichia coli]EFB7435364.1 hypothetical protein [Escherichia coli]
MEYLCCSEVSISPLFRRPNSVCHFSYQANSFVLKCRGKTWCAHRFRLYSHYRVDLSTGSGALH